jgi:hypothetical protein
LRLESSKELPKMSMKTPDLPEKTRGPMTETEKKLLLKKLKKDPKLRASKDVMLHFPDRSGNIVGRFITQLKLEEERTKSGSF